MAAMNYTIKDNRIERSFLQGMELSGDVGIAFDENEPIHRMYLDRIDGAMSAAEWGRLSFNISMNETQVLYVYVSARDVDTWYDENGTYSIMDYLKDPDVPDSDKKRFFSDDKSERYVGKKDILLYGLSGRYLFVCIEVLGAGDGYLSHIHVDRKGDNFMDAFPAVYRERNGFFHRFLSIFSSLYNDLEHEIGRLPELLDADVCPAECLDIYAAWLGIDLSGNFLTDDSKRKFVKEAYNLNRMKGTKACLLRVIEIILDEKAIILENNTIKSYMEKGEMENTEIVSGGIFDVNVLIRSPLNDTERRQLLYILDQFKPIRCKLHLVQLRDTPILDDEIYLDMNAVVSGDYVGVMDDDMTISEDVILDE